MDPHLVFSIHAQWLTTTCYGNFRRPLILFRTLSVIDIPGDTPPLKTDFYSLSSYQLKKKNLVASFGTLSTAPFPQGLCVASICAGLVHALCDFIHASTLLSQKTPKAVWVTHSLWAFQAFFFFSHRFLFLEERHFIMTSHLRLSAPNSVTLCMLSMLWIFVSISIHSKKLLRWGQVNQWSVGITAMFI